MHPLSLCDVQLRTAVLAIGILSFLYYAVQIVAWILNIDLIMKYMGQSENDVVLIGIIFMIVASLSVATGVQLQKRILLLPYMILGTLTSLGLIIGVVISGIHIYPNLSSGSIGIFFIALLHLVVMIWIIWVITIYYIELSNAEGYSDLKTDPEFGGQTRQSNPEAEHLTRQTQKPTVVSEFMKRIN